MDREKTERMYDEFVRNLNNEWQPEEEYIIPTSRYSSINRYDGFIHTQQNLNPSISTCPFPVMCPN